MIYRFGDYSIDTDRLELRLGDETRNVEPQVFSLIAFLVANRDRVVSKDELIEGVWNGRIVSDAALNSRINAARRALGDDGKVQAVIRTVPRRGFRFVADVAANGAVHRAGATSDAPVEQEIRFCTARDGVRIAYAVAGEGPPLVKAANWLNHLEFDWESPVWRPLFAHLAASHRLIRHDQRGNGLSDWNVADLSLEAFVDDLEAVVDAAGIDRFALLGISQGCPISVAYAVRHPERVSHMVLYGGFARGARRRGGPVDLAREEALATLIREGWGQENPAFRQIFTTQMMPEATEQQMRWFNDLQRMTTSPQNAVRLRVAIDEIDISPLLDRVAVPTLVLHRRGDGRQPFEEGRLLAAGIPNARFVALEGRNHIILENEPEWARFTSEIGTFLKT